MITVTLKITDVNPTEKTFRLWIGNFGHELSIDDVKQAAANLREENVSREILAYLCALKIWEASKSLGVAPKDMTNAQLKTAIEKAVEV